MSATDAPPTAADGIPRRNRIDLLTPVEKAIVDAQYAVESAGGSPRLTEASVLLSQARDAVADHVEGITVAKGNPYALQEDPILQFFAYAHLPAHLQERSKPFSDLAQRIVDTLPRNPERTVALRKLLEAKDAGVRAAIWKA